MSHTVTIETEVKDASAVEAACRRLGHSAPVIGEHTLYSGRYTGLAVQLPGWHYPIVCDLKTGEINYDNFEGLWGDQQHLDRFLQGYAAEKTRIAARAKGYTAVEQTLPNGCIAVEIRVGGAA
ncbi:MAG TPA: DUF1257 domain-containing protein [Pirellulales bacterium]|nr:DUF1257 domain-containing protein [Pirellulales bacterium]